MQMKKRYPCVRQVDHTDCGAAALASIALYYKNNIALQRMRDLAGTDREGTNLLGLVKAAEAVGFSAKAVQGCSDSLLGIPLPAIAHVANGKGSGHYAVLYRIGRRSVIIADPEKGTYRTTLAAFLSTWSGYLILIAPDATARHFRLGGTPASSYRRFVLILNEYLGVLSEAAVCALLMTLLGIATSYFIQHLVDSVLVRSETRMLNALSMGMALVVVFRTLFSVLRQYLLAHVGRRVDLNLSSCYARHILELPVSFFEMRRVGEIISRFNDASKIREAVSGVTLTALVDGLMVMITLLVLWAYDAQLAAVATLFAPAMLGIVLLHHSEAHRRSLRAMEASAALTAHLAEDVTGIGAIKAFNAQGMRQQQGETRLLNVAKSSFAVQSLNISVTSWSAFAAGVAVIVVLWFGGHRVISGALSVGELLFFYTLLGYMLDPISRLATVSLQLQDALVAIDRLYEIMDLSTEPNDPTLGQFTGIAGALELRDVSFQYGCRSEVLTGISLCIPAGSTVAIVGESGCGKSTLLKLLMRFYEPTAGSILADGVELRHYDLESFRACIGFVDQEACIFDGTIRENIMFSRSQASMNEVIEAARLAGLEQVIAHLPDRYETPIGERGSNLSGGQRQRLAIARALLGHPGILFFDEATSHLDTNAEQEIQENLRNMLKERTVVIVAHRLSAIRDADLIYVMDRGQIVEQGTHEQLLEKGGRYARCWLQQSPQPIAPTARRANGAYAVFAAAPGDA